MTLISPTSVIRSALNNRADVALSGLEARTCHSWKMNLDRAGVLARTEDFIGHHSFHLYLREGAGGCVVDLDGNRFIDLSMGFGSLLLGHGVQSVRDAVMAQASRGWHLGAVSDRELELARYIQSASASIERILFCNSGADAVAAAILAAREFTGRDVIGVFTGSSHDAHDYRAIGEGRVQAGASLTETAGLFARPWHRKSHSPPGVPQAIIDSSIGLPYGHPAAFDQLRRRRHDVAAVIVEPVPARDPSLDHASWLRELANVCSESGILLILDERLTGFRLAYGGAQERLGFAADLIAYGECIGGGLPLGAVAGRADIICNVAARESQMRPATESGPYGCALSLAAGAATLEHVLTHRTTLYPALEGAGRLLAGTFNSFAEREGLPARMRVAGSIFRIQFKGADRTYDNGGIPAAERAFYALVLNKGVLVHATRLGFLSAAHSANDIAKVGAVFQDALTDVRNDGLFDPEA